MLQADKIMRETGPTLAMSCAPITLLLCGFNMLKAVLISAAVGLIKPTLPANLPFFGLRVAFFGTFPFSFTVEAATLLSSVSLNFVVPFLPFCLHLACLDHVAFCSAQRALPCAEQCIILLLKREGTTATGHQ